MADINSQWPALTERNSGAVMCQAGLWRAEGSAALPCIDPHHTPTFHQGCPDASAPGLCSINFQGRNASGTSVRACCKAHHDAMPVPCRSQAATLPCAAG